MRICKVIVFTGAVRRFLPQSQLMCYKMWGLSKTPLVITDITSTCGCTVPKDWSKEPLAPGESAKFTVKFNGKGTGKVTKTVTLIANTESGKERVKVTATIKADPNATNTPLTVSDKS